MTTLLKTAVLAAREDARHDGRIETIKATLQTAHFAEYAEYKVFRAEWIALYLQTRELPSDSNAGAVAFGVYGGTSLNPNRKQAEESAGNDPVAAEPAEPIDLSAAALATAYASKDWKQCRAIIRAAEALAKV
jgi:hypothetical protein